jgi:membrane protein required for colicin V production
MSFSVLDVVFMILVFILSLRCFFRGFITEFISMASLVLGLLAAFLFHKPASAFVMEKWLPDNAVPADVIAIAALFIIVFIVIKILGHFMRNFVSAVKLGGIDRFIGFAFGFAEGVLLVTLIVWVISIQPFFDPRPLLESSVIAQILLPLAGSARETIEKSVIVQSSVT